MPGDTHRTYFTVYRSFLRSTKNIDLQRITACLNGLSRYIYNIQTIIMKAILTLCFVLTFGAMALANSETDVKINGIEMGVVLVSGADSIGIAPQIEFSTENRVVRLYKFQNARITKALEFATKRTKAKLV